MCRRQTTSPETKYSVSQFQNLEVIWSSAAWASRGGRHSNYCIKHHETYAPMIMVELITQYSVTHPHT